MWTRAQEIQHQQVIFSCFSLFWCGVFVNILPPPVFNCWGHFFGTLCNQVHKLWPKTGSYVIMLNCGGYKHSLTFFKWSHLNHSFELILRCCVVCVCLQIVWAYLRSKVWGGDEGRFQRLQCHITCKTKKEKAKSWPETRTLNNLCMRFADKVYRILTALSRQAPSATLLPHSVVLPPLHVQKMTHITFKTQTETTETRCKT